MNKQEKNPRKESFAKQRMQQTWDPKSFRRSATNRIQLVQQADSYVRSFKPLVTKQEINKVKNRIIIDGIANTRFRDRQMVGDYYIKYHYNPLSSTSPNLKKRMQEQLRSQRITPVNLVNLLKPKYNQQNEHANLLKKPEMQKLSQMKVEFQLNSQRNIKNLTQNLQPERYFYPKPLVHQVINTSTKKQDLKLHEMQIENIANFEQDNHFLKNYKKINIFKIAQDCLQHVGCLDHLNKHNFQFNGMIERNYKFRFPIYRDLSQMARNALTKIRKGKYEIQDYIFAHESTLNKNHLIFDDLLSVASNRMNSNYVYKILNGENPFEDNDQSEQSSIYEHKIIHYKKNNNNQLHNFADQKQQANEIEVYKKVEISQQQKVLGQNLRRRVGQVLSTQKLQNNIISQTIKDKKVINSLNKSMKSMILNILNENNENQKSLTNLSDVQKKVRLSKRSNKKDNMILIRQCKQMLKKKNQLASLPLPIKKKHGKFKNLNKISFNNTIC